MHYDICSVTGKRIFMTSGEAKNVLTKPDIRIYTEEGKRIKRRMSKRKETRYYYCTGCEAYHLTSMAHFNKQKRQTCKQKKEALWKRSATRLSATLLPYYVHLSFTQSVELNIELRSCVLLHFFSQYFPLSGDISFVDGSIKKRK